MAAFGPSTRQCHCGAATDAGRDQTHVPHVCVQQGQIFTVEREVAPDMSKLNRADRRAIEAIARRNGWKIR